MKVVLISNAQVEYDGRLRELIKIAEDIGETTAITNNRISYFKYIFKSVKKAMKINNVDILFIDNRKAVIPGLIINFLKRPKHIILDVRELYLIEEQIRTVTKIGCIFEKIMIKKADIVICANIYRANIMKDYFKLKETPLVYENIRKLEYDNNSIENIQIKYDKLFSKDTFKIVATSGFSPDNLTDKLVECMSRLGNEFELFIAGTSSNEDLEFFQEIINKNSIKNITILGKLKSYELKYVLNNVDVGIVSYCAKNTNYKYCASGKIYEFIYEELPVVASENLPLVEIIESTGIGVCDNNFYDGLIEVKKNYNVYKQNVIKYKSNIDVSKNNKMIVDQIKKYI